MPKPKIQLKNLISSDKVKIFETNHGVFVGNVEQTTTFNNDTSTDNMYSIKDTLRAQLLNNYYEIETIDIQSFNTTLTKSEQTGTPIDFITQGNPEALGYTSLVQIDGYGYLTSDNTINGLRELSYSDITSEYDKYNQEPHIFVYPPSGDITLSGDVGNMLPIYNLSGVNFNYLTEVATTDNYFDFQTKHAYGNTTNLKNHLNENWDTGSMVTSATTLSSVSATLENTRNYLKVNGSIDGSLHFIYNHKESYTSDNISISNDRQFDDYSLSALTLSGSMTNLPMSGYDIPTPELSAITTGDDYARRFDYVESIKPNGDGGFNKYGKVDGKKSNMYSINIQNANINDNTVLTTKYKEDIKKSINNVIRNVIGACTPINTQLAKIYWNGE